MNLWNITRVTHTKTGFEDPKKESQGYELAMVTDSSYQGCHRSPCKRDYWNENRWASPSENHAKPNLANFQVEETKLSWYLDGTADIVYPITHTITAV